MNSIQVKVSVMRGQVLVIFTASLVFVKETQLVSIDNILFGEFSVKLLVQIFNLFSKKGDLLEQLFVSCFERFD